MINNQIKRHMLVIALAVLGLPRLGFAATTDIGAPETGVFAFIGSFLQQFVDFLEGPFGLVVPIIGLSLAVAVWMLGSRGGESSGWIGRVVIGSLIIVNIPAMIIALQGI